MAENKKKLKEKQGLKNKDAVEFMLVNRGVDDPNYRKENISDKILLLVPKEDMDDKTKAVHDQIISKIPQINRGVYSDEHVKNEITKFAKNEENVEIIEKKQEEKKVVINLVNNKVYEFDKNEKNPKIVEINSKNETKTELKIESKEELITLDDKKIDEIFKRVKLPSDVKMVEYNSYGLPKNLDPEIYNYITNKEFKEGVDEFIPASRIIPVNNYDIDIKPEEMDEEHKDLFDAIEQKYEGYEELEDNFVMLANEGKIPINVLENPEILKEEVKNEEEMVMINQNIDTKKKPKYITEEEREYLNKKFNHCFENEYKNKDSYEPKERVNDKKLNEAIDELICKDKKPAKKMIVENEKDEDEEDYEEYEYDEEDEEEYEDYENDEEDENEDEEDDENDKEAIRKANEGKIKIEYIDKKKPKLKPVKKEKGNENMNEDFENLFNDEVRFELTIGNDKGNRGSYGTSKRRKRR